MCEREREIENETQWDNVLLEKVIDKRVLNTTQLKSKEERGQLKSGQLKSGQLKSGQLNSGQLKSGQLKSGWIFIILIKATPVHLVHPGTPGTVGKKLLRYRFLRVGSYSRNPTRGEW